jgi:iron complex transport system permease protein
MPLLARRWADPMTNGELLIIAVILFAAGAWWTISRTTAAAAPVVLAFIMLTQGVGGPVWEWAKWSAGAGLPPFVKAASFAESKAVPAFLWASIGASVAALLIRPPSQFHVSARRFDPPRRLSIIAMAISFISFAGFLVGQGPSFLSREVYLLHDGIDPVLKVFWPLGVLFGLISVVLITVEEDRLVRWGLIFGASLWYIGPVAVASRTSLAVPLAGAVAIVVHQVIRRRVHPLPLVAAAGLLALAIFTFSILLEARLMPHGLLNMPNVVRTTLDDSLSSTDSLLLPIKQLTSSIFASVPNAEQSAIYGVDPHVLIANANPLPGTSQPMELERYWPYEWVPLSFVGTWYGAFGTVAQVLLFGSVGLISGYAARNIQCSRFPWLYIMMVGFTGIIGALSIQYPSRMVWRLITTMMFVAVVSFLTRRSSRIAEPEESPAAVHDLGSSDLDPQLTKGYA